MELLYVQVFLSDGAVSVWSSLRGRLDIGGAAWRDVFKSTAVWAQEPQSRAMIHLVGDDEAVSDDERAALMESARRAGYGAVRIETGEPLDPEEAFQLLALPFT